jgi:phosphoglycolate phosphatase-like HAD superfamily hydrolase
LGLGFGFSRPASRPTVYRNAFTGDVEYVEQAVNGFRAAYEKRKGDPLGVKRAIQGLDEDLERMRGEAEKFGAVTLRGSELLRSALRHADAVQSRFESAPDEQGEQWNKVRSLLQHLSEIYRPK